MFSYEVSQKIASKRVHNKDIEELEKKWKQFLLKIRFHKTISRRSCRKGYTRNIWKNVKIEMVFLDERSFSQRYNLISYQWLSTGKMYKKLLLNAKFSMKYRFHVKLSGRVYQWGRQDRCIWNWRIQESCFL